MSLKTRKKRKGYWKAYEKANIKDYRKVWNITRQIVEKEELPFKRSKRGRHPKLPLWMYICLAVLYVYFDDPFRETEKLLTLVTGKKLDHSNIIRWFGKLKPSYISNLTYRVHLEIIKQSSKGDYVADSSGVTCDRYKNTISRGETMKELINWKLHIFAQYLFVLGLVSIVSVWSTHGDVGDSPIYRKYLLKPERVKKGKMCHADKAYFGRRNIEKTKDAGLIPNFVPKEVSYTDPILKKARFEYDNEARKNNRGLVETPFGGLETEMDMRIRCRKPAHRNIVTCLLGLKHNIKTLLRAKALKLFCYFRTNLWEIKSFLYRRKILKKMKKIGGLRRKRRHVFKKDKNKKGKISLTRYFQSFEEGDRVKLSVESAVQKGMYHPRFYGKVGVVKSKTGRCYEVSITDGNKQKILIVHPVHLQKT